MLRNPGPFDRDTRRSGVSRRRDGKCHRKQTAWRKPGDGEKVRQERTARSASDAARQTPSGARPNRKPRSGPLRVSWKRNRFRVSVAQTNDSLRRKAQTEFGLQPFQNQFLSAIGHLTPCHFIVTAPPRALYATLVVDAVALRLRLPARAGTWGVVGSRHAKCSAAWRCCSAPGLSQRDKLYPPNADGRG